MGFQGCFECSDQQSLHWTKLDLENLRNLKENFQTFDRKIGKINCR